MVGAGAKWANRITGYDNVNVEDMLANPRNWRIHPQDQQEALLEVLHAVGLVQNIIVNARTGTVVDGHLRVQLAMRDGQTTLPVTYVDLSDEEEALVLATYDPISALAAADPDALTVLLADLETARQDVDWTLPSIDVLLANLALEHGVDVQAEIGTPNPRAVSGDREAPALIARLRAVESEVFIEACAAVRELIVERGWEGRVTIEA